MTRFPAIKRLPATQNRPRQEHDVLSRRIKMHLPTGGNQRMPVQDHDLLFAFTRQPFQPFAQVNLLRYEQLIAETAYFPKRLGLAEDK
jgi:hypothetical protein